jgi:hypothetical protein
MQTQTFIILLAVSMQVGCAATTQGIDPRTAELEKENARLREKDAAVKARLATIRQFPFRSPLEDFFASPEFWECTYDSGASDCAARCASEAAALRAACEQKPSCEEKQRCYEEAAQRAAACVQACPRPPVPTDPAICR